VDCLSLGIPTVHQDAYVDRSAIIIGEVNIEENVIVAPQASLRADEGSPFRICKGTNIQDSVVLHGLYDQFITINGVKYSIYIGSHCSIAHGALIHGPTAIGKKTFIGFRSIIHKADIHRNCFIGHGAQVIGVRLPPNSYVPNGWVIDRQSQIDELPAMPDEAEKFNQEVVDYNKNLVAMYKQKFGY